MSIRMSRSGAISSPASPTLPPPPCCLGSWEMRSRTFRSSSSLVCFAETEEATLATAAWPRRAAAPTGRARHCSNLDLTFRRKHYKGSGELSWSGWGLWQRSC